MIELKHDSLSFSFAEVHPEAKLAIDFVRTLRIPDDDRTYPLPPGLGSFPMRHVDDFNDRVPRPWLKHGGVLIPMYQAEALWISFGGFRGSSDYPFAVKIAAGKINAVTGESWDNGLHRDPQDYLVVPTQPWLDGYCVEKGLIRQFVAMPLGSGYSAEEQLTGSAGHGGLQILVCPMKAEAYRRRFGDRACRTAPLNDSVRYCCQSSAPDMGLAAGGRMHQEIYDDPFNLDEWDTRHVSRCFIHLCNAVNWRGITGSNPPTEPPTAKDYTRAGLPWFDYYDADAKALEGSDRLAGLKSVATLGAEKGEAPLADNESIETPNVLDLRRNLQPDQVREAAF